MFYAVSINKQVWTKDQVSVQECEARGFSVAPARRVGELDVFHGIHKVAILFKTQADAASYAAS